MFIKILNRKISRDIQKINCRISYIFYHSVHFSIINKHIITFYLTIKTKKKSAFKNQFQYFNYCIYMNFLYNHKHFILFNTNYFKKMYFHQSDI